MVTAARPDPRRGYAWSQPPIRGESLIGFVSRNLAHHGLDDASVALRPAGIKLRDPGSLLTAPHDPETLAGLFRADPVTLAGMGCPPVANDDTRSRLVSFFGTPLRLGFVSRARRVSPRSLARSPHHRATWHLRTFAFCPESLETLLSRCPDPACAKPLGWRRPSAPWACEHCGTDLRDHPQDVLFPEDGEALAFVTGLVDPDPNTRSACVGMIPEALRACSPGEVFEFAVMLAGVLGEDLNENRTTWRRLRSDRDFARLDAATLGEAGRVLLGWPEGFHVIADRIRGEAEARTSATYGKLKELGVLLPLSQDPLLPSRPRAALRAEIDANMRRAPVILRAAPLRTADDWVTFGEASRRFGLHPSALRRMCARPDFGAIAASGRKAPVMVRASRCAQIAREDEAALAPSAAARRTGIDPEDLESLAAAGFVAWLTGPAEEVKPTRRRLTGTSVAAFEAAIMVAVPECDRIQPGWVRLDRALASADVARSAVPEIVAAVLARRIPSVRRAADRGRPPLRQVHVPRSWAEHVGNGGFPAEDGHGAVVTVRTAALRLGVPAEVAYDLIRDGWIPAHVDPRGMTGVTMDALRSFRDRHMLTGEVARLAGWGCRATAGRLARLGVVPAARFGRTRSSLWDRDAVRSALCRRDGPNDPC